MLDCQDRACCARLTYLTCCSGRQSPRIPLLDCGRPRSQDAGTQAVTEDALCFAPIMPSFSEPCGCFNQDSIVRGLLELSSDRIDDLDTSKEAAVPGTH